MFLHTENFSFKYLFIFVPFKLEKSNKHDFKGSDRKMSIFKLVKEYEIKSYNEKKLFN